MYITPSITDASLWLLLQALPIRFINLLHRFTPHISLANDDEMFFVHVRAPEYVIHTHNILYRLSPWRQLVINSYRKTGSTLNVKSIEV